MNIRFGTVSRVQPDSQVKPNVSVTFQEEGKEAEHYKFRVDDLGGHEDLTHIRNIARASSPIFEPLIESFEFKNIDEVLQIYNLARKQIACYLAARAKDFELLQLFLKNKTTQFTGYSISKPE